MAKPAKRKIPGGSGTSTGRVTPKANAAGSTVTRVSSTERHNPPPSTRYTPPRPANAGLGPSGRWVPITMFTLLGAGVLMIIINYLGVLLPGAASNWYIIGGLGLILSGIIVATQWR